MVGTLLVHSNCNVENHGANKTFVKFENVHLIIDFDFKCCYTEKTTKHIYTYLF
jgi:hypothetical protein